MPIVFIESQYPPHKNNEVLETWFTAIEKHPVPENMFKTLVDTAVSTDKNGFKVCSAYLPNPGKYEETSAYLRKFMTTFIPIKGYVYEFKIWSTIEEAMGSIEVDMPDR